MTDSGYLLVIARPAQRSRQHRWHEWLRKKLAKTQWSVHWFWTGPEFTADLQELQHQLQSAEQVLATGGDGTLHLAVNVVAGTQVPLGYLPAGSGNDFARYWLRGLKREQLLAVALYGPLYALDLGTVELAGPPGSLRYFVNSAGAGLDGALVREQQKVGKWGGQWDYSWRALKLLWQFQAGPLGLKAPSPKLRALGERAMLLLNLANNPYFGGGMFIAPHARGTNGQLAWTLVEQGSGWQKLRAFPTVYWGGHTRSSLVHTGQLRELTVTAPGWWLQADGEIVGQTPARFGIRPQAICVRLPSPAVSA